MVKGENIMKTKCTVCGTTGNHASDTWLKDDDLGEIDDCLCSGCIAWVSVSVLNFSARRYAEHYRPDSLSDYYQFAAL
jgi:hypothetical protein